MSKQNDFIFHGDAEKGLKIIRPRRHPTHDHSYVFASRYKAMAACYMLQADPDWARFFYDQDGLIYFVTCDPSRARNNPGGSVYMLDATSFHYQEYEGMRYMEWLCSESCPVLRETSYSCALKAMQEHGVHLLEMDEPDFKALEKSFGNQLYSLLSNSGMDTLKNTLETYGRKIPL